MPPRSDEATTTWTTPSTSSRDDVGGPHGQRVARTPRRPPPSMMASRSASVSAPSRCQLRPPSDEPSTASPPTIRQHWSSTHRRRWSPCRSPARPLDAHAWPGEPCPGVDGRASRTRRTQRVASLPRAARLGSRPRRPPTSVKPRHSAQDVGTRREHADGQQRDARRRPRPCAAIRRRRHAAACTLDPPRAVQRRKGDQVGDVGTDHRRGTEEAPHVARHRGTDRRGLAEDEASARRGERERHRACGARTSVSSAAEQQRRDHQARDVAQLARDRTRPRLLEDVVVEHQQHQRQHRTRDARARAPTCRPPPCAEHGAIACRGGPRPAHDQVTKRRAVVRHCRRRCASARSERSRRSAQPPLAGGRLRPCAASPRRGRTSSRDWTRLRRGSQTDS